MAEPITDKKLLEEVGKQEFTQPITDKKHLENFSLV
jgi:hypothetical protein